MVPHSNDRFWQGAYVLNYSHYYMYLYMQRTKTEGVHFFFWTYFGQSQFFVLLPSSDTTWTLQHLTHTTLMHYCVSNRNIQESYHDMHTVLTCCTCIVTLQGLTISANQWYSNHFCFILNFYRNASLNFVELQYYIYWDMLHERSACF